MARKKSVGLFLTALTVLLAAAGFIAYMVNTGTNYYAKMGVDTSVVACLVIAVVVGIVTILVGLKGTPMWADILPVAVSVLLMVGFVMLLNARVNNLAAVFTFENSAANMADTTSCIVAIASCLIAALVSIISAFFDITKEQ